VKIPDWALAGGLLIGGYLAYKEGLLTEPISMGQKLIDDLFAKLKKDTGGAKGGGKGTGGGGNGDGGGEDDSNGGGTVGGTPGGATGSCTGGPYKSTGKTISTSTRGPTTRHYASGKDDDKTIEKNAKSIPFQNYQFVNYVTMNSIEHDDTVSVKYGGTHMGSGWYDHGISFNSGQGCLGTEKKHPSAQLCVIKGKSIGKIVGKKIGIAGVIFSASGGGGKTELWADSGTGWQKLAEGVNVNNFKPSSGQDEAQLRIDGFNAVPTIHCSVVQEIVAAAGSFTPTTKAALAQFDDFRSRQYQAMNTTPQECGFMCSYETTSIPAMQAIQRGLYRG
jgi:hypothetical protein